jgi:hypothetical protein
LNFSGLGPGGLPTKTGTAIAARMRNALVDVMKVPLIMPKRDVSQKAVASQQACSPHLIIINDGLMTMKSQSDQTSLSVTFLPLLSSISALFNHLEAAAAPHTALSRASRPQPCR